MILELLEAVSLCTEGGLGFLAGYFTGPYLLLVSFTVCTNVSVGPSLLLKRVISFTIIIIIIIIRRGLRCTGPPL